MGGGGVVCAKGVAAQPCARGAPTSDPPARPPPAHHLPPATRHQLQEEKRRRTALREARIAFLEEEVPALAARGADMASLRRKMSEVNKKLGEKFEISEAELQGTYDACRQLMEAGEVRGCGARSGGGGVGAAASQAGGRRKPWPGA